MGVIEYQAGITMMVEYRKSHDTKISFDATASDFIGEGSGVPSAFSSFGLDGELRSKPDLGAPGGNILSVYPRAKGSYAVLSGTSMSSSYIAGSHALYMQAKKSKPRGDEIRKVLKNTASISRDYQTSEISSAAKQGSGLVNVLNAVLTTTSISPDHIDLLDTVHFKKSVKIEIKNSGKYTQTYTLSHVPVNALSSYYPPGKTTPLGTPIAAGIWATVKFSSTKVKIAAGKSAKVTLTFQEPAGKTLDFLVYSGFVVATPSTKDGIAVHVPYTGMKGDVGKVPIMDKDEGLPGLSTPTGIDTFPAMVGISGDDLSWNRMSPGYLFDLTSDLPPFIPVIVARLESHTPDLTIRVFNTDTGKFEGFLFNYHSGSAVGPSGRTPAKVDVDGVFDYKYWTWYGYVVNTESPSAKERLLPSGTYTIVVAAQRKLSKGNYPVDFEVNDLGSYRIKTA
ncbi:hypothetical protein BGZ99_000917 [Dissophora globulifera]|uniref:Peptidase S8/S53 domain-containing protein n=1 Tax=Dissophora globulifera TaxID=979702 RepID=A0A9P6R136_9FUNG|nr:hypothetical protein BGZ99_000917 [Dissophora globulifera]